MANIIDKHYDNSFDNMGESTSFVWYGKCHESSSASSSGFMTNSGIPGPRWASAATAPSRAFKTWTTEGGIRCPCLVRYPGFGNKESAISSSFATVMDVLPTVLELAKVQHPGTSFRGRTVALPRGKTWVPHLSSSDLKQTSIHGEDTHIHGWELFGMQAIREGPWKAMWIPAPKGKDDWELFNVEKDPAEKYNLVDKEPEILKRLVEHWERYFAETGMIHVPQMALTRGVFPKK